MREEENIDEFEVDVSEDDLEDVTSDSEDSISIDESELALEQERKRADELDERLLRVQAEFDNYRKRMDSRFQDVARFASEGIILKILEVLDNLQRAVEDDFHQDPGSLKGGIQAIVLQISKILTQEDVRPIDSLGTLFDPYYQHAVSTVCNPDEPDGIIVEEFQRGYMIREKVLRPAMVVVNRHITPEEKLEDSNEEHLEDEGE